MSKSILDSLTFEGQNYLKLLTQAQSDNLIRAIKFVVREHSETYINRFGKLEFEDLKSLLNSK